MCMSIQLGRAVTGPTLRIQILTSLRVADIGRVLLKFGEMWEISAPWALKDAVLTWVCGTAPVNQMGTQQTTCPIPH